MPDEPLIIYCVNLSLVPGSLLGLLPSGINLQDMTEASSIDTYFTWADDHLILYRKGIGELDLSSCYMEIIKRCRVVSSELLVQSLGSNYKGKSILDITAGLGRDSIILAMAGLQVCCIEYSSLLIVCLCYAKHLLRSFGYDLEIRHGESSQVLQELLSSGCLTDYVYFDPMFIDGKSAKSKKPMQMIAEVAYFANQEYLFDIAYNCLAARGKLIVKRDNKQAEIVTKHKTNYQKIGKTVRFDVYLK